MLAILSWFLNGLNKCYLPCYNSVCGGKVPVICLWYQELHLFNSMVDILTVEFILYNNNGTNENNICLHKMNDYMD